ncbi:uncharacterized protein RNJ42_02026 [Nakaseomyces bracarensis]|uniref:uncharacterized protein n=1 Tax=Nakaseomyces bracarensis TaxID=273131 RepID=UPI0038729350
MGVAQQHPYIFILPEVTKCYIIYYVIVFDYFVHGYTIRVIEFTRLTFFLFFSFFFFFGEEEFFFFFLRNPAFI